MAFPYSNEEQDDDEEFYHEDTKWICAVCSASNQGEDDFCYDCGEHRDVSK